MFGLLRQKSQVEKLIKADGMDRVTDKFSEIIARKLTTRSLAVQFIREELDGASRGNVASKQFAEQSGFLPSEYEGALQESDQDVDGPDGPQQLLLGLSMELMPNQELAAKFRCMIDEKIMSRLNLGKYSSREDRFDEFLRALNKIIQRDKDVMPSLTLNIPPPVTAQICHVRNRKKNVAAAKELIIALQKMSSEEIDALIFLALEKN